MMGGDNWVGGSHIRYEVAQAPPDLVSSPRFGQQEVEVLGAHSEDETGVIAQQVPSRVTLE